MVFKSLIRFLLVVSVVGCAGVPIKLDSTVFYRRDMKVSFDGRSYYGIAVLPNKPVNEITIETRGKLDLLTITTCNREFTAENLSAGLFGKNRYVFRYQPIPGVEDGYCPIDIGGYEAIKGRHAWAFLDRESAGEDVPTTLVCNGELKSYNGVSVCQSKLELTQRIAFAQDMAVASSDKCPIRTSDQRTFDYEVPVGVCVYKFKTRDGRFHRHTSIGYENIVITEQ